MKRISQIFWLNIKDKCSRLLITAIHIIKIIIFFCWFVGICLKMTRMWKQSVSFQRNAQFKRVWRHYFNKHIHKIVRKNMCVWWKIENDLTPENLLAYLFQWYARRLFLLGQGSVFIVEFFVDSKNGTLKKTTFVLLQVASFSCIY